MSLPQPSQLAVCRFYLSTGCKRGSSCTFLHPGVGDLPTPKVNSHRRDASRIVPKPTPKSIQLDDPKSVQHHHIARLKRRYPKSVLCRVGDSTTLQFDLIPSDPDFPFDIDHVDITLTIPPDYPISSSAIHINNSDIPRGYAINIERAWNATSGDFLDKTKDLDRRLANLLSMEKVETLKIVKQRQSDSTAQFNATAKDQREKEIGQLKTRLRDLKVTEYGVIDIANQKVVINPDKGTTELPKELQGPVHLDLTVPLLYPTELPYIKISSSTSGYARNVERGFATLASDFKDKSLFSILNILQLRFGDLAKSDPVPPVKETFFNPPEPKKLQQTLQTLTSANYPESKPQAGGAEETANSRNQDGSSNERGISISFPNIHLSNISLVEISSLSLTVNCCRCKSPVDVSCITPYSPPTSLHCHNCSLKISVALQPGVLHQNDKTIGYLDLVSATPLQLGASLFQSTCADCGTKTTPYTLSPSQAITHICRKCHVQLNAKIDLIKFIKIGVSPSFSKKSDGSGKKLVRQNLGISIGNPLPNFGRCAHYKKSSRWFRFPCCLKVFACDKCHDESSDHPCQFANRQICGYCSKEQMYSPDKVCVNCGENPVKKNTPFWEGGKGTRDKTLMSRKDARKYKK